MFTVQIENFKTKKQALEFIHWYEGGGEQQFYDHLDIVGMNPDNGCNVNMDKYPNSNKFFLIDENVIKIRVE